MVLNLPDVEVLLKNYPNQHVLRGRLELRHGLNDLSMLESLHRVNQINDDLNVIRYF